MKNYVEEATSRWLETDSGKAFVAAQESLNEDEAIVQEVDEETGEVTTETVPDPEADKDSEDDETADSTESDETATSESTEDEEFAAAWAEALSEEDKNTTENTDSTQA